jgi:hypothetical protein
MPPRRRDAAQIRAGHRPDERHKQREGGCVLTGVDADTRRENLCALAPVIYVSEVRMGEQFGAGVDRLFAPEFHQGLRDGFERPDVRDETQIAREFDGPAHRDDVAVGIAISCREQREPGIETVGEFAGRVTSRRSRSDRREEFVRAGIAPGHLSRFVEQSGDGRDHCALSRRRRDRLRLGRADEQDEFLDG